MMEVIESELERESIGLAFECFDFVVDSLDDATRDAAEVIVQEPITVVHECGGIFSVL